MNRRKFLAATAIGSAAFSRTAAISEDASVAELQNRIKSGELTSEHIVYHYLERIERLDRRGPSLHSVLEINPDALATARALDTEHRSKGPRSPLHGIPILLKDNIDTADKLKTTAGSLALLDAPTPRDSWAAERLRAAGAIILGQTNLRSEGHKAE